MPEAAIDPEHPALPGHFPGHPVVPAVVLLSRVIAAVRDAYPGVAVTGIRRAKFLGPVAPGDAFDIELGVPTDDSLKFACRGAGAVVIQGRLEIAGSVEAGQESAPQE